MKYLVFLILLTTLISPVSSYSQGLQITDPIRFLALGDSYTIGQSVPTNQRWPVQLMDSLETRGYTLDTLRIIATTGWRTDNLLNAIRSQDLQDENYNLVSLLIGVNNQYQGRPFSQYTNEFPILLDSAISYAGGDPSRVFVVSIPDYAYTPFGQQSGDPDQISMELDQYNAFNQQIAADYGVTYFNITPISRLGIQHPEYVANDGLHPSGIQYTEWVQLMLELIDSQLTGITPEYSYPILDVNIFPNPALNEIAVELLSNQGGEVTQIEIFSMEGNRLYGTKTSRTIEAISLMNYPPGMYLLKINSAHQQLTRRFVKI